MQTARVLLTTSLILGQGQISVDYNCYGRYTYISDWNPSSYKVHYEKYY